MENASCRFLLSVTLSLLLASMLTACGAASTERQDPVEEQDPADLYFGQEPPGMTPVQFAPDIFREELHATVVFSPDGNSVFWSEMEGDQIQFMERVNDIWGSPHNVPFALPGGTGEPMFAPNGETLFFLAREAVQGYEGENIWKVTRTAEGWSAPEPLGPGVNNHPLHWTPSASNDGSLYFGHGGDERDIYVAEFRDGVYQDAISVGPGVNSGGSETTPFIAPDGRYLLFSRSGPGSRADLYVSFPAPDGTWQEAVSLGDRVNTAPNHELGPVVSPDGEYLFFIRNVNGDLKPHWVRSAVFTELRPE